VSAQHSSDSAEHGTSPAFVELGRAAIGFPDVDPASSQAWNKLICARRVITREENGLRTPWFEGAPVPLQVRSCREIAPPGRRTAHVNPPGDREGVLVAAFWIALAGYFALRWVTSAIWIGFNVEQLARLQRVGARSHPLEHVTLVPARREGYRPSPALLATADQPPHASFVTLLTRDPREIETFATLGAKLGCVINGNRR
jgi:hypothetical protein